MKNREKSPDLEVIATTIPKNPVKEKIIKKIKDFGFISECRNGRCITRKSYRRGRFFECYTDADCYHYECNDKKCEKILAKGFDLCLSDSDCESFSPLQVSLTADPTKIQIGAYTTLTYKSENADEDRYCTITSTDDVWTDDSIHPNTEGSHSVTLNEAKTYTFTFTCYDKDGNSKSATAEVTVTEQGTTTTTTTTTTTKPPSPSCRIMEFTINGKDNEDQNPIMVWVNSVVKGHWLANGFCTDCSINCSPSGCNWSQNNIGTQGDHQFRITQSNLYTYTLTCWGENQDTDTETLDLKVRAVNLPKWREIIPILPFLRGLFPWGK